MIKVQRWRSILIILLILSGCSEYMEGSEIPVISLLEIRDLHLHDDYYPDKTPTILVVSSEQERNELVTFIPRNEKATIDNTNLDAFILLAVFDGERFNSGYYVTITKAIKQPAHLYVYAQFIKPKPGQLTELSGPRSAFSIVTIERNAFVANEQFTVHLMDNDTKQEILIEEYTMQ